MGNFGNIWNLSLIGFSFLCCYWNNNWICTNLTGGLLAISPRQYSFYISRKKWSFQTFRVWGSSCSQSCAQHWRLGISMGLKTSSEPVQWISGTGGTIPAPSFLHLVHQARSPNKGRKRGQTWPYPFQIESPVPSGAVVCVYVEGNVPQFCSESIHWLHSAQN